jgi:hypothetical protein
VAVAAAVEQEVPIPILRQEVVAEVQDKLDFIELSFLPLQVYSSRLETEAEEARLAPMLFQEKQPSLVDIPSQEVNLVGMP